MSSTNIIGTAYVMVDQYSAKNYKFCASTLEELSIPSQLIEEIMAIVASTRNDILNR